MIGIDTNVLVRYIMHDDRKQALAAERLLHGLTEQSPGHVSAVVLAELSWVLTYTYGATRDELGRTIETLLKTAVLIVEQSDFAHRALSTYRATQADLADALLTATNRKAGCSETVTFDKKAARDVGMVLIA